LSRWRKVRNEPNLLEGRYDAADLHFYGCVDDIAAKIKWIQARLQQGKRQALVFLRALWGLSKLGRGENETRDFRNHTFAFRSCMRRARAE
jgi:hypothetical protein